MFHLRNKEALSNNNFKGFTIVELLVVIVVIGILAAISIVSYTGVSQKAVVASIQSDLSSSAKQFKLYYVDNSSYPIGVDKTAAFDANNCPKQPADTRYCIKLTSGNTIDSYVGTATSYRLVVKNGSIFYSISDGINGVPPVPIALTVPVLINPTSASITSSGATIGATIQSDGGSPITESGTCWGTNANPTGNCLATPAPGGLTALSPVTIASGLDPNGIVVSTDGKSVYTANFNNDFISIFSRNLTTGSLTISANSPSFSTFSWSHISISNDGKSIYMSSASAGSIYSFSRDTNTNVLTFLEAIFVNSPKTIAISADNKSVYITSQNSNIILMYSRNTTTGILTALTPSSIPSGTNPTGLAISNDGKSVYASNYTSNNISVYTRNVSTGALASAGSILAGTAPICVSVSSDGLSVYATNFNSNNISMYLRNLSDGSLVPLTTPTILAGTGPRSISISNDGVSAYVPNLNSSNMSIYSRDSSSGMLAISGTISIGASPASATISSDDTSVYVAHTGISDYVSMFRRNSLVTIGSPFSQARIGMPSLTTIHYRGYAKNAIGTGYSPDGIPFTTL